MKLEDPPPASAAPPPPLQRRQSQSAVAAKKEVKLESEAVASSSRAGGLVGAVKRESAASGAREERAGQSRAAAPARSSTQRQLSGGSGRSVKREKRKAAGSGGDEAVNPNGTRVKRQRTSAATDDGDDGDDGAEDDLRPDAWDAGYWAMLRFVEVHGHARVPSRFGYDPALGKWVSRQRKAYAAELERKEGREPRCTERITAARIKKLQRIGFEWTLVNPDAWKERFAALRRFVKKHGHARVPKLFADDPALGRWVATQRKAYAAELERKEGRETRCTNRITAARIKKLQRIGFEWRVG